MVLVAPRAGRSSKQQASAHAAAEAAVRCTNSSSKCRRMLLVLRTDQLLLQRMQQQRARQGRAEAHVCLLRRAFRSTETDKKKQIQMQYRRKTSHYTGNSNLPKRLAIGATYQDETAELPISNMLLLLPQLRHRYLDSYLAALLVT